MGCYLEVTRGEATRDAADAEEADAAAPAAAAGFGGAEGRRAGVRRRRADPARSA